MVPGVLTLMQESSDIALGIDKLIEDGDRLLVIDSFNTGALFNAKDLDEDEDEDEEDDFEDDDFDDEVDEDEEDGI